MNVLTKIKILYLLAQNKLRYFGRKVTIGNGSRITWKSSLKPHGGSISIGRNCELHEYALVLSYGGNIVIGDHSSINPFCVLYGHGGLSIGKGVRIASHVVIIPASHIPGDDETPLYQRGVTALGIEIGDYTWLGTGARILDGVKIGRHAIVGAGSVVRSDVPDFVTVAGVPARIIRQRDNSAESK